MTASTTAPVSLARVRAQASAAIPVNYAVLDGDIIVRTGAQTSLATRAGQAVSFEVDHVDEALAAGWSVLVSGSARVVTTPYELETVRSLGIKPWAGGNRDTYIRITVTEMTGRRIRASTPQHAEADTQTGERR